MRSSSNEVIFHWGHLSLSGATIDLIALILVILLFTTNLYIYSARIMSFCPPHPHLHLICDEIIMFSKDIRVGLKHQKEKKEKLNQFSLVFQCWQSSSKQSIYTYVIQRHLCCSSVRRWYWREKSLPAKDFKCDDSS